MAVNSYKDDEQSIQAGKLKTLGRLFSYLLTYKKQIAIVLAIMAFCVVVTLMNPLFIESAIDKYITTNHKQGLLLLVGTAAILNLLMIGDKNFFEKYSSR